MLSSTAQQQQHRPHHHPSLQQRLQLLSISREISAALHPCFGLYGLYQSCGSSSSTKRELTDSAPPVLTKKGGEVMSKIEALLRHPFGGIFQKLASSPYSAVWMTALITTVLVVTEFLKRIIPAIEGEENEVGLLDPINCCETLLQKILPCIHAELQHAKIPLSLEESALQYQLERVFFSACNTKIEDRDSAKCISKAFSQAILPTIQLDENQHRAFEFVSSRIDSATFFCSSNSQHDSDVIFKELYLFKKMSQGIQIRYEKFDCFGMK